MKEGITTSRQLRKEAGIKPEEINNIAEKILNNIKLAKQKIESDKKTKVGGYKKKRKSKRKLKNLNIINFAKTKKKNLN